MSFIGLLGLIGLIGFFSSKNLSQNLNKLNHDVRNAVDKASGISSRVDGNEKNLRALNDELRQIISDLKNCATTDELEKILRRLNELQAVMENFSSDKKILQTALPRIEELDEKFSELQMQANADASKFQDALKILQGTFDKNRDAFDGRIKALESRPIPTLSPTTPPESSSKIFGEKLAALDAKSSEQTQILLQYKNFFGQIQYNFNALQQKINDQQNLIVEQRNLLDAQQKLLLDYDARIKRLELARTIPPPTSPLTIRDFQIKKTATPLFSDKPADASKVLEIVENLSELTTFLENSSFDEKNSFVRQIDIYKKNLDKFNAKIRRGKFDAENFSEEATEAFWDVLSKYFLSVIPVAIYRGNKKNTKFYSDFLAKVNKYLNSCHVYTALVEPKKIMLTDQLEFMSVIKKDTSSRDNDKIIDEVERLPYFIDYFTEDGEIEKLCSEGKMIVLKFSGDKK